MSNQALAALWKPLFRLFPDDDGSGDAIVDTLAALVDKKLNESKAALQRLPERNLWPPQRDYPDSH